MISCTIECLSTWNPAKTLPERCDPLTSSTFQAFQSATGAEKKNYTRAVVAACPNGSLSLPVLQRRVTAGKVLRYACNTSQESLWDVRRGLVWTAEKRLKDGNSVCSKSSGGSRLLQLDIRELNFCRSGTKKGTQRQNDRSKLVRGSIVDAGDENEYCDRPPEQPHGACSFRRSSSPSTREGINYVEVSKGSDPDQVRLFCPVLPIPLVRSIQGSRARTRYVEKVKRARIKELADTLRQTAGACMFFSCVRGIVGPLVEVFQTRPPRWGRLILMLSAFDSFAITYLSFKASEPLEKLSILASENEKDIMGSIEKEEEHMLALAVELVKLFRRLRNITVCTAVAQFASLVHSLLRLNNPKLVANATKIIAAWLTTPWN